MFSRNELQPVNIKENGRATNAIGSQFIDAKECKQYLSEWENRYPKAKRIQPPHLVSDREIEQLKSLGYLN